AYRVVGGGGGGHRQGPRRRVARRGGERGPVSHGDRCGRCLPPLGHTGTGAAGPVTTTASGPMGHAVQSSPCRRATVIASRRRLTPSLRYIPRRWVLTVLTETNRELAISSAVRMDGSSASSASSRLVSPSVRSGTVAGT